MLIVDAQIHLWNAGNPTSPWHRQIPAYLKENAVGSECERALHGRCARASRPVRHPPKVAEVAQRHPNPQGDRRLYDAFGPARWF
jgi:hypothetical protein